MTPNVMGDKGVWHVFLLSLSFATSLASIVVTTVAVLEFKSAVTLMKATHDEKQELRQQNAALTQLIQRSGNPASALSVAPTAVGVPVPLPYHAPSVSTSEHIQRRATEKDTTSPKSDVPKSGEFILLQDERKAARESGGIKLMTDK